MDKSTADSTKKGHRTRTADGAKKGRRTRTTERTNLIFPVSRFSRRITCRYAARKSANAAVFSTAILQFVTSHIIDVAARVVKHEGKSRIITPRTVARAINSDENLKKLFESVAIINSDFEVVKPKDASPVKTSRKKNAAAAESLIVNRADA